MKKRRKSPSVERLEFDFSVCIIGQRFQHNGVIFELFDVKPWTRVDGCSVPSYWWASHCCDCGARFEQYTLNRAPSVRRCEEHRGGIERHPERYPAHFSTLPLLAAW